MQGISGQRKTVQFTLSVAFSTVFTFNDSDGNDEQICRHLQTHKSMNGGTSWPISATSIALQGEAAVSQPIVVPGKFPVVSVLQDVGGVPVLRCACAQMHLFPLQSLSLSFSQSANPSLCLANSRW